MPQRPASNHVRLGLFVVMGLGLLLVLLFLLGRQQNLFSRSLVVQADFRNVSGLLTGNNVRLGGIPVGTVRKIHIRNDSTVRVEMSLNRDVRPYVRKNALATIGTDGLVGNTIINLTAQPGPAAPVDPGDLLATRKSVGIDAILSTLQVSNTNLVGVTQNLRDITGKLKGSAALWKLLNDEELIGNVRHSLHNVEAATGRLSVASQDVVLLTRGVRQGRGPLGYLLTDRALAGQLGHAGRQLAAASDTLAGTMASLQQQVRSPGPVHTLLTDSAFSRQLRQSMQHVEQGTRGFSQSMEALQHNFLLRGYFRRQEKKRARQASAQAPPAR